MELIGRGTSSKVYKDGDRAIKCIKDDDHSAIREIFALRECTHENVIALLKVEYTDPTWRLYFDHYPEVLSKWLMRKHPREEIYKISSDITAGTAALHAAGIIHGDLKPQNILVRDNRAVVADLGICAQIDEPMHESHVQTANYRAPEVSFATRSCSFTEKIDIWSLGCIFYELIAVRLLIDIDIKQYERGNISLVKAAELYGIDPADVPQLRELSDESVHEVINNKISQFIRRDVGQEYKDIIAVCMRPSPFRRPDAAQILASFNAITAPVRIPPPIPRNYYAWSDLTIRQHNVKHRGVLALASLSERFYRALDDSAESAAAAMYAARAIYSYYDGAGGVSSAVEKKLVSLFT